MNSYTTLEAILGRNFEKYAQDLDACRRDPATLEHVHRHLFTYFETIRQVAHRGYQALYRPALDFILALYPLAGEWGHWEEWEEFIRLSIEWSRDQDADHAAAWGCLAQLLHKTGRWDEALDASQTAAAIAKTRRMPVMLVHNVEIIADILNSRGHKDQCGALLDEMAQNPDVQSNTEAAIRLALITASYHRAQGRLIEALFLAEHVVGRLEQEGVKNLSIRAFAHNERGAYRWVCGLYRAAADDFEQAKRLYAEQHQTFSVGLACGNLGLVCWSAGDLHRAEKELQESIRLAEELNAQRSLIQRIGNLGLVQLSRGNPGQALRLFERQQRQAESLGFQDETGRARGNRGVALLAQGHYQAAREELEFGLEQARRIRRYAEVGCFSVNLCHCAVCLGDQAGALAYLEEAERVEGQLHLLALKIIIRRARALFLDGEARIMLLREALALAHDRRRLDEAACLLALAHADPAQRVEWWQRGVRLLEEMGASAWIQGRSPDSLPLIPYQV
jgi:tetratricopeptide (TPR) repeat protein